MQRTARPWRTGRRVAIVGCGPGAISTALAFIKNDFDVRIYERNAEITPLGGGVLLATPVLAILRYYGLDLSDFGTGTVTYFKNDKGQERARLGFNPEIERRLGIQGWHYGILRSNALTKMLGLLPDGVLFPGHKFTSYEELDSAVQLTFEDDSRVTADILVGADGIRSAVSEQAFGKPPLFHVGLRAWLGWYGEKLPDIPPNYGFLSHSDKYQASFFPMMHNGKPGYEWWLVEPAYEGMPVPEDPKAHVSEVLKGWCDPIPRFVELSDFKTQVFRWEIYNRPEMKTWSKGRVVCVGDAVHPVSPYAAYGMGMAIEDGYFLARALKNMDLTNLDAITAGFQIYEQERVEYVNHNVGFARFLGRVFHNLPYPLAWLRDCIFDYTPFLQRFMQKGYLSQAEVETLKLKELHVSQ